MSPGRRVAAALRRVLGVARVETLRLLRDRTTIGLVLVVPALQVALFGAAIELDPKQVPIALAHAGDPVADRLREAIAEGGYFRLVEDTRDAGAARRAVAERRAAIGIELPPAVDYLDPDAAPGVPAIVADGSDPAAVRPALAALQTAVLRVAARGAVLPSDVEWLYNPDRRTAWTVVPGLIGVVVMIGMLMMGALTLVRERERGTWEALLVTPVTAAEALAGKLAPYVVIGTLQAVGVLVAARLLFALPLRGDVVALVAAVPLFALAHLVLGFAFSALAESQLQALQGAVFFYLPSMLLSGFLYPFDGMPRWARAIGEALPLTHFVRAARGVLLRGEGARLVAGEMLPVAAFALASAALALAAYRRRLD